MGYIVLNSKFKPFSYQEMLAPIMQAQEAHDKADAEINTLLENAALNASSFGPNDTAEKAIYDDLIGRLKDASDQLSNRGINPSLKREISNINKEYRTSLLPIQKKLTKRAELAAEQRKLQSSNPYIRFSKDYNNASLNEIHDASTYGIIDLEKITEQAALDFQKETSGITRTDFEPIPIGNTGHYNVITGYGYTPKEMKEAWGDTNNPIYQKYLEKIQYIDSLDYNDELKDEMKLAIWEGMKAGAGKFSINEIAGKTARTDGKLSDAELQALMDKAPKNSDFILDGTPYHKDNTGRIYKIGTEKDEGSLKPGSIKAGKPSKAIRIKIKNGKVKNTKLIDLETIDDLGVATTYDELDDFQMMEADKYIKDYGSNNFDYYIKGDDLIINPRDIATINAAQINTEMGG